MQKMQKAQKAQKAQTKFFLALFLKKSANSFILYKNLR
jgi:hypothetical protein